MTRASHNFSKFPLYPVFGNILSESKQTLGPQETRMSGYLNAKNAHSNGNLQSSEKLLFEQLDAPKMVQSALSSTTYIDDLYPNSKSRRTLLSAQPNMPLRLETKNTNDDVPQNPVSSSCPQEDQWVSYCSDKFPGFQELYNQRQKLIDIINNTTSAREQTQAMDAFLTLSKKLKKFRIQTHPDRATQNGNPLAPYRNCPGFQNSCFSYLDPELPRL